MIATDSDREGEAIARLIINLSGNSGKTIKRLWINSLETSEMKKGFQNLKDGQAFYSTYKEAETRQIADWLVGINLTRLYTLYMQKNGSMRRNSLACLIYNLSRINALSTVPTKRFRSLKNSMKKRCFLIQEAIPIILVSPNLTT